MNFPIDVAAYKPLKLNPANPTLSEAEAKQLETNIQVVRDTLVFFTAIAGIKGFAGHTGGAFDIVPEVLIADGFMKHSPSVYPAYFDEAGHRVAIQYAMAAFNGEMPFEKLYQYRAANEKLYGHPEIEEHLGIKFASGRLGHMWPFVNGVALANRDKAVFMFGSDGSQMEGNDAEAARLAVAQKLNVKLCIDDNNVTISGHPSDYLPGFDVAKTLEGHGLTVDIGDGEDVNSMYERMARAMNTNGPVALINRRVMAPGIPGIEGSHAGHDVIGKDNALAYLREHGQTEAIAYLGSVTAPKTSFTFKGSSAATHSNRTDFGKYVAEILDSIPADERAHRFLAIDSDLEGSTGLKGLRQAHPDVCINGGVQERGNLSAAAGFGFAPGKQGLFSTFSAFLEMIISEATMARLNGANLMCHFSHAGVDEIADNTCHYGVNVMLADCGIGEADNTRLYFSADTNQLKAVVNTIWSDPGIRYVFSTRSKVPLILKEDGSEYFGAGYTFTPGKDDVIREGKDGYVVAYGELLYRALDAVERAREAGLDVGLVNKATLNVVDEASMAKLGAAPFVLVVEGQNIKTGLGSRFGTWLLQRGFAPKFDVMAVSKPGEGGIAEHIFHQGLDADSILAKIKSF